jgi:dTDP-4-amino-4,6-dideoxygalactose transaminase
MQPILVDIETGSYGMDPACLASIFAQKPRIDIAIPVHLFGKACDPKVREVCDLWGVSVIEDAAESTCAPGIGWGDALTTSFFSNHLIAGGSGGAIMTNNGLLDLACWKLINHGRSGRFGNEDLSRTEDKFRFDTWGHSMKWSDVSAALVKAQLERRTELLEKRKLNASVLCEGLRSYEVEGLLTLPTLQDHCFMMFPILLSEEVSRERVVSYCHSHGIETRRMMPITDQPVVQPLVEGLDFPVADRVNRCGFYVGCHPDLSTVDMEAMVSILSEAITQEVQV